MVAIVFTYIAWLMIRKIGIKELFIFGENQGPNEYARLVVFGMVIGMVITCLSAVISEIT